MSTSPITPEQLFEVLADAESWPHWATVITKVTWTSPEPRGVGTTRTVSMRGGIVGDEEFLAWEPFTHMAFRFNESTSNAIAAFAEDYRVVETAGGCHLTWVMAMKPNGLAGSSACRSDRPRDGVAVPAVPAQSAPLHRRAVRPDTSVQTLPRRAPDAVGVGHGVVAGRADDARAPAVRS